MVLLLSVPPAAEPAGQPAPAAADGGDDTTFCKQPPKQLRIAAAAAKVQHALADRAPASRAAGLPTRYGLQGSDSASEGGPSNHSHDTADSQRNGHGIPAAGDRPAAGLKLGAGASAAPFGAGGGAPVPGVAQPLSSDGAPAEAAPARASRQPMDGMLGCYRCRFAPGGCLSCRAKPFLQRPYARWAPDQGRPQEGIPCAPTFYPTEEEFKDPLSYISKIREEGEKYGVCRIVPPASWDPPFSLQVDGGKGHDTFRFSTRKQFTSHLCKRAAGAAPGCDDVAGSTRMGRMCAGDMEAMARPAAAPKVKHEPAAAAGAQAAQERAKQEPKREPEAAAAVGPAPAKSSPQQHAAKPATPGRKRGAAAASVGVAVPVRLVAAKEEPGKRQPAVSVADVYLPHLADHPLLGQDAAQNLQPPQQPERQHQAAPEANGDVGATPTRAPPAAAEEKAAVAEQAQSEADSDAAPRTRRRRVPALSKAAAASAAAEAEAAAAAARAKKRRRSGKGRKQAMQEEEEEEEDEEDEDDDGGGDFGFMSSERLHTLKSFQAYCKWAKCIHFGLPLGGRARKQIDTAVTAGGVADKSHALNVRGARVDKRIGGTLPRRGAAATGPREPTVEDLEAEFWRLVEQPTPGQTVETLYGSDLDSGRHGSGFPLPPWRAPPTERPDFPRPSDAKAIQYSVHPWNVNNMPRSHSSVLRYLETDELITGVMVPWLYVGSCMSAFCWHIEDHGLCSVNYLHMGAHKVWYGVPASAMEQFEEAMRDALPHLFEADPMLLHRLVTTISPRELKARGVPVYRLVHEAGSFVVTFPNAYHAGFNCGFNCAEAVNFAPVEWLPHGTNLLAKYRSQSKRVTISHDSLLVRLVSAAQAAKKAEAERAALGAAAPPLPNPFAYYPPPAHAMAAAQAVTAAAAAAAADAKVAEGPEHKAEQHAGAGEGTAAEANGGRTGGQHTGGKKAAAVKAPPSREEIMKWSWQNGVSLSQVPGVCIEYACGELSVRLEEERRRRGIAKAFGVTKEKTMSGVEATKDARGVHTNTHDTDCAICKCDLHLSSVVSAERPGVAVCPEHAPLLGAPATKCTMLIRHSLEQLQSMLATALELYPGGHAHVAAARMRVATPLSREIKRLGPICSGDLPLPDVDDEEEKKPRGGGGRMKGREQAKAHASAAAEASQLEQHQQHVAEAVQEPVLLPAAPAAAPKRGRPKSAQAATATADPDTAEEGGKPATAGRGGGRRRRASHQEVRDSDGEGEHEAAAAPPPPPPKSLTMADGEVADGRPRRERKLPRHLQDSELDAEVVELHHHSQHHAAAQPQQRGHGKATAAKAAAAAAAAHQEKALELPPLDLSLPPGAVTMLRKETSAGPRSAPAAQVHMVPCVAASKGSQVPQAAAAVVAAAAQALQHAQQHPQQELGSCGVEGAQGDEHMDVDTVSGGPLRKRRAAILVDDDEFGQAKRRYEQHENGGQPVSTSAAAAAPEASGGAGSMTPLRMDEHTEGLMAMGDQFSDVACMPALGEEADVLELHAPLSLRMSPAPAAALPEQQPQQLAAPGGDAGAASVARHEAAAEPQEPDADFLVGEAEAVQPAAAAAAAASTAPSHVPVPATAPAAIPAPSSGPESPTAAASNPPAAGVPAMAAAEGDAAAAITARGSAEPAAAAAGAGQVAPAGHAHGQGGEWELDDIVTLSELQ